MARQLKEVGFVHLHVHSSYSLLEGALKVGDIVKLGAGRPSAGARAHRHQQPVRRAGVFREGRRRRHPADRRDAALGGVRGGRPDGARRQAPRQHRGAGPGRGRLRQPAAAGEPRLLRHQRSATRPASTAAALAEASDGLIALTGGFTGPVDAALRANRPDLAESRLAAAARDVRREPALRRVAAPRPRRRAPDRGRAAAHGRPRRPLDRRRQRAVLRQGGRLRRPRRPARHRRRPRRLRRPPPASSPGCTASRPARRWPSSSPTCRTPCRRPSRSRCAAPSASAPASRSCRTFPASRRVSRPRGRTRWPRPPCVPAEVAADEPTELRRQAEAGLELRLRQHGPCDGLHRAELPRPPRVRARRHHRMKFPGYFLIVSDFIKWAKDHDIPVGPGRGSGAGSLVAYALTDHRSRPAAVRPAVRALPQPRARLDAGLRHRLLRRWARARHPATCRSATARSRSAQIITFGTLQARGVHARRRPRAGDALRAGRQADQARAEQPGQPGDAATRRSRASRSCSRRPRRSRSSAACWRSPRSSRACTATPRPTRPASSSATGRCEELVPLYRDPKTGMRVTQYNMKWVEPAGPREVRLPRPEDAHRAAGAPST